MGRQQGFKGGADGLSELAPPCIQVLCSSFRVFVKKLHYTSEQCEFPEALNRKPSEDKADSDKSALSAEHCQRGQSP